MAGFELSKINDVAKEQAEARGYWSQLNNFASFYAKPQPWSQFMAERITSHRPCSVFEFGANVGKNLLAIQSINPNIFVAGIDVNAAAVEFGREKGLRLSAGDETNLFIFPDKCFDVTFTVSVIDHVAVPDIVLTELARITRDKILLLEPWLGEEGKVNRNTDIKTGEMIDTTPYSYSWDYLRLARECLPTWRVQDEPYMLDSNLGRFYRLYTFERS